MHDHPRRRPIHAHALRWLLPLIILALVPLSAAGQGAVVWQVQVGTPAFDSVDDLALDSAGNIYLVGSTEGDLAGQTHTGILDAFVSKYTASGAHLWTRLAGVADNYTYGLGVAVDADDHVYLVGTVSSSLQGQAHAGLSDAYVQKYDRDGAIQWTRLFGTAQADSGEGIAIDGAGRIYITGGTDGSLHGQVSAGGSDAFLSVYDSSGAHQWTRQTGSSRFDHAFDVAVDSTGSAYLAGFVENVIEGEPISGDRDAALIKFDSGGAYEWTRLVGTSRDDAGYAVEVDASGNSYLVGYLSKVVPGQNPTDPADAFVRKYDSSGAVQWSDQFGSPDRDMAIDVTLDAVGNLYLVGDTHGQLGGQRSAGGISDLFVRKYAPSGSARWTFMIGTPGFDMAPSVAVSPTDMLYLAGWSYRADQSDLLLARISNPTLTPRRFLPLIPQ